MARRKYRSNDSPKRAGVSWTLLIALFGGIPGLLGSLSLAYDHFKKTSVSIEFEPGNSIACTLNSPSPNLDKRPAILLYRLRLTGLGIQPTYLRDIKVSIKTDDSWFGGWIEGKQFFPPQDQFKDKDGISKKSVDIVVQKIDDHDNLHIGEWEDFNREFDDQKGLPYGQPVRFSYAAYFDTGPASFEDCRELRIKVKDSVGEEYKQDVDCRPLVKNYALLSLNLNK